ncbi:carboxypeptidase-like regulatory domain-containing protein [Zhouia spongiae]|uniref:Carboxypeptidase-like regulatory domain-containing protein n=1 Tax=Zhouia spongiae TaxID=2202721 RepID=A0ABY3YIB3_9FLAO|nr:carboxypeptidase-like regulatory domain-containing protein [Zhouia spongiae]UNY97348.1 carboxypeptidase-like regulatory domain-containing protein [Zhouia spongiae]
MTLKTKSAVILLIFGLLASNAQTKLISGKINAPGNLEGVHVINLNTQFATITNIQGFFEIEATVNDSLKFSSVEYKNRTISINADHIDSEKMIVTLETDINMLDDVVVTPYNLSGNLGNDLNNIKLKESVNAITLGLPNAKKTPPTQLERRYYTATTSAGPVPLDLIINTITGRIKRLKNQLKLEEKEKATMKTKRTFEKSFYTKHLKIPEHKIDAFIYFCAGDEEFHKRIKQNQPLLMLELLQQKSIEFHRFNSSEQNK